MKNWKSYLVNVTIKQFGKCFIKSVSKNTATKKITFFLIKSLEYKRVKGLLSKTTPQSVD